MSIFEQKETLTLIVHWLGLPAAFDVAATCSTFQRAVKALWSIPRLILPPVGTHARRFLTPKPVHGSCAGGSGEGPIQRVAASHFQNPYHISVLPSGALCVTEKHKVQLINETSGEQLAIIHFAPGPEGNSNDVTGKRTSLICFTI